MVEIRLTRAEARALAIDRIEKRRTFWRRALLAIPTMKTPPLEGPIDEDEIAAAMFDVVAFRGTSLHEASADLVTVVRAFPEGPRVWFAIAYSDGDVQNGGFWQYFGNPTGDLVRVAIDGFRAIGAERHAELFERATARLFPDQDVDCATRRRALADLATHPDHDAIGAELTEIEDAYFALEETEPLPPLLRAFASARRADFFLDA